jgi:hypothetical protein
MKNNAKRVHSPLFKRQDMSPGYYRHDQMREDSARAQGAAALRWREQVGRGGGGSPGFGGSGSPVTPAKTPASPSPAVPALQLRSAGREGRSTVPSPASTVRDKP